MPPEPRLDHVVINARRDLDGAAGAAERAGFVLTPPSRHTLGSINRLALFPDHYLELVGIDLEAPRPRAELMISPAGLNAIVFATDDADALHRELLARGAPVAPPLAFSRPVGDQVARFRTVHVAAEVAPFGRLYFCQHLTRDLVWGAAPHEHGNGAAAIAGIRIESREPAAATALLRLLLPDFLGRLGATVIEIVRGDADRIAALTLSSARGHEPVTIAGAVLTFDPV